VRGEGTDGKESVVAGAPAIPPVAVVGHRSRGVRNTSENAQGGCALYARVRPRESGEGIRPATENADAMVVLGIDPGLANCGYGVVVRRGHRLVATDGGVIATPAGLPAERRLATLHARLCDLLDEHEPDALALEALFFGQNVRTAFAVGQARGVVLLAAGQHGVGCVDYTPQQVKGSVCGTGRADKDQVARMVQTLLSLPQLPRPDHAADALAVAICHANHAPLAAAAAVAG
jgi:crossover junction endodeoxyribonuclease RuvC